jgi:hypothetical protein
MGLSTMQRGREFHRVEKQPSSDSAIPTPFAIALPFS